MDNRVEKELDELQKEIDTLVAAIEQLRVDNFKLKTKLNYSEDLYLQLVEKVLDKIK